MRPDHPSMRPPLPSIYQVPIIINLRPLLKGPPLYFSQPIAIGGRSTLVDSMSLKQVPRYFDNDLPHIHTLPYACTWVSA